MQELHNNLMTKSPMGLAEAYDKNENFLISDTSFNSLIPPHVKKCSINTK